MVSQRSGGEDDDRNSEDRRSNRSYESYHGENSRRASDYDDENSKPKSSIFVKPSNTNVKAVA